MTDADSIETTGVRGACAWCEGPLKPRHFVRVARARMLTLCSEACLEARRRAERATAWRRRWRNTKVLVVVGSVVAACVTPHDGPPSLRRVRVAVARPRPPVDEAPLPGAFGPEWPPSEASLLADLGRDAWVHPLAGPFRRMPLRDSRVFGSERAGDRPIECRKGHCGVDLGGEIWGEHVHAAHDGVVDRVVRAPNEQHGGHYVRLAHRNGSVFTQYFHLAAVPRALQPGVRVKAGDVIGLLGDTGVKESTAHLHFTVSVRPADDWPEQYVDPEPLIALWPLRIPIAGSPVAILSTGGRPGVPIGGAPVAVNSAPLTRPKPTLAKRKHVHAPAPKIADEPSAPAAAPPADDEPTTESSE